MLPRKALPEWQQLETLAQSMRQRHLRDLWTDSARTDLLSCRMGPLLADFSKQRVTICELEALLALAKACVLQESIAGLLRGERVNTTENRAALHSALRLPCERSLLLEGLDIVPAVHASLSRMEEMVVHIHSGQWRGFSGRAIRDVVNIGVGGSDLGPFMACTALAEFAPEAARDLHLHFVSSIDGTQISDLLNSLNPETTLFIISSKSFTTVDTFSNANTAWHWMLSAGADEEMLRRHHFVGISTRPDRMTEWGIAPENQLLFWEWVGGRFSLWSAIGLPIALRIGMKGFRELLAGAHALDEHFLSAPLEKNLPVLMGLVGVWNATFLDIRAHAVLPYDGRLKHFPAYLTQLEMESNGKSVSHDGEPVTYSTCPVLWGEVGPNAQHAFYQLLHQGTQPVSCDFIAPVRRYDNRHVALQQQHQLSLANCLAQSRVLMLGDASVDNASVDNAHEVPKFRRYHGNQPSTTLLLDELTPYTLGQLIALYENKVFVMSVIWNINPFDQWGVELGKQIADSVLAMMSGGASATLDGSTAALMACIKASAVPSFSEKAVGSSDH